jgi:hypothetical protein
MLEKEVYYCWRMVCLAKIGDKSEKRFITPWGDPRRYEHAFNFLFVTPEEAIQALNNWGAEDDAREESWVLCRETTERMWCYKARLFAKTEDGSRQLLGEKNFYFTSPHFQNQHRLDIILSMRNQFWDERLTISGVVTADVEIEELYIGEDQEEAE